MSAVIEKQKGGRKPVHGQSGGRGKKKSPEYSAWMLMLMRCRYPKYENFARYGGRGIRVCDRWLSFVNFLTDMGPKPTGKHTLERKDTDGDYTTENCVWATPKQQARNKCNNRLVTLDGETKTVAEWSEVTGLPHYVICGRLNRGWSVYRALTAELNRNPRRSLK